MSTDRTGIDFVAMEIFHFALRRDLAALRKEFDTGLWETFAFELHFHHVSEDRLLWPVVRAKLTAADDLALLDALEAEHAQIDPLLAEAATGTPAALDDLAAALEAHLEHEERDGLPLIDAVLTPAEWETYLAAVRDQGGDLAQNPAVFLPWLLREAPDDLRARMLAGIPDFVKEAFGLR
ncbi:hypothetical protein GCM10027589_37960 [Actinocorallia lasiicapitis]